MAEVRQMEFANRQGDPGERDGSLRPPLAVFPSTGMRFSPILSIRAGILRDGYGKFMQFAARRDGEEIENRDEASATRGLIPGDHLFCDDLI